jgi:hypothetical protein
VDNVGFSIKVMYNVSWVSREAVNLNVRIRNVATNRKVAFVVGAVVILIVSIDLLMSRQILSYTKDMEVVMFTLTVVIGYGIGSWILLGYTKTVSKEIRAKSHFINSMHWTVTIIQFSLLATLLFVLFNNTTGFLSPLVFTVSSITACVVLGIISFKFFSWYKLSKRKNLTVLLYGLAAVTLAISIAEDVGTKLLMIQVIQEKSPPGAVTQSTFVYKPSKKYNADIEYKVVNPHTTTLYLLPNSNLAIYNYLNSIILPIAFVFRWFGSIALLRSFYQRIAKLSVSFWIILSLPLIFYLVGKIPGFTSGESMTGVVEPYRYFFRVLYRGGTIAGNILFGLAFFIVARSLTSLKVKDYLTITGIGFTMVGISLSTSALQQTYGIASHSLLLLSSYLFSIGFYVSALSVSQDSSLRKSIRSSTADLVYNIGSAEMEQHIENTVRKVIQNQQKELEEQTGGFSHEVSENDVKEYMTLVIEERKLSSISASEETTPSAVTVRSAVANTATPVVVEEGTPGMMTQGLIKELEAAGATVRTTIARTERRPVPVSSFINHDKVAKYELTLVNGDTVRVFEFENDFSDEVTNSLVNSLLFSNNNSDDYNAAGPGTATYHHFYKSPKLIAHYVGKNPSTMSILVKVLGEQLPSHTFASLR